MFPKYLTECEQRRLLDGPKRTADALAQRDWHWLNVLLLTGMRIEEFSRLTVALVRRGLHAGWLVSPKAHCKGKRRANEYLVTAPLRRHLEGLCALSDTLGAGLPLPDDGQPLVWGRNVAGVAGPLSVRGYQDRLKYWVRAAQLDARISPHWLRHTRGMNIMRRSRGDNPLKVCQQALNHVSLASTGVYLRMSREEYERELQVVDGGRLPKRRARALVEAAHGGGGVA